MAIQPRETLAAGAVDMFIKIDGIKGEATGKGHEEEISLLNWSFGATQGGTFAKGTTGGGAGIVSFQDLKFDHYVDKALPLLMQACASGEHIKKAVLIARKAGKTQQDYFTVTLEELLVSSVNVRGAENGQALPVETVSLNFSKILIDYKPQKGDGSLGAQVHGGWDLNTSATV